MVSTSHDQLPKAEAAVTKVYTTFGMTPTPTFASNTAFLPVEKLEAKEKETEAYFFHPDHLGSSNYITNFVGEVSQHMEYFAFGETFIEEHKNSHNSPYKFNGKELDEESGLYYYGARYLDMRYSIWNSTDPLSGYNPIFEDEHYIDFEHNDGVENSFNLATYSYCYQNPILYTDPNGKQNVSGWIHGGLDVVGLVPGFGEIADGVNALYYLGEGNYADATLSAAAMVPIAGYAANAAKAVKYTNKAVDAAKVIDKVNDTKKALKNADKIAEGRKFEADKVKELIDNGKSVSNNKRLVPQNGKGNVKGNRTNADALVKNKDGKTYTINEYKRTKTTKLSDGQKAAQANVKKGNQKFEVRSNIPSQGLKKGDIIEVTKYKKITKYK